MNRMKKSSAEKECDSWVWISRTSWFGGNRRSWLRKLSRQVQDGENAHTNSQYSLTLSLRSSLFAPLPLSLASCAISGKARQGKKGSRSPVRPTLNGELTRQCYKSDRSPGFRLLRTRKLLEELRRNEKYIRLRQLIDSELFGRVEKTSMNKAQ